MATYRHRIAIMLLCGCIAALVSLTSSSKAPVISKQEQQARFEKAVQLIKKYETLHQPRHWPLVGYGHMVMKGEKFSRNKAMSEKEAEALLRKDLLKNCAVFREYGSDSLLLGTLAYNIGSGKVKNSALARSLRAGNRNVRSLYLSHNKYRGKTHRGLTERRIAEFDILFAGN